MDYKCCPRCKVYFVPKESGQACPTCGEAASGWYYAHDGRRCGLVSTRELKALAASGDLAPADCVRRACERKWHRAKSIRGLFPITPTEPLPLAPTPRVGGEGRIECRHEARAEAQVVPEPERCVQCGICSYNCPMEIDVRAHAHRGVPIRDSHCLTCSECVTRCPRGVLSFERIALFTL